MIYCSDRKIGIFFNPKTGTNSLRNVFLTHMPSITYHHQYYSNIDVVRKHHPNLPADFNTYKFYAFYRDPVDRFIDAFKTYKRTGYSQMFLRFFSTEDSKKLRAEIDKIKYDRYIIKRTDPKQMYHWLSQETKDKIESLSITKLLEEFGDDIIDIKLEENRNLKEIIRRIERENPNPTEEVKKGMDNLIRLMTENMEKNQRAATSEDIKNVINGKVADFTVPAIFIPQRHWLDYSDLDFTYLNFHNFDSEIRRLAALFDITLDTVPHDSPPDEIPNDPPMTAEEIASVKHFYQKDYDFFASKGITFV